MQYRHYEYVMKESDMSSVLTALLTACNKLLRVKLEEVASCIASDVFQQAQAIAEEVKSTAMKKATDQI